jgi:hypothetical protein
MAMDCRPRFPPIHDVKAIHRERDRIIIALEHGETAFLRSLPARLRRAAMPTRYAEDSKVDAELRQLLDEDLATRRQARVAAFEQALGVLKGNRIELTDQQAEDWLALLTDLRIALAEKIGIKDESWERSLDLSKPVPEDVRLYLYLTSLQTALIEGGFGVSPSEFLQ